MALVSLVFVLNIIGYGVVAAPNFHSDEVGRITSHSITEESGLAASHLHANVLYTHNDSGGQARIFAIDARNGNRLATINIAGAHSHDWEDIATGSCPNGGGHCIYIGDTGGNAGNYEANRIYRIQEPNHLYDRTINVESTLHYSWDQHDCETVMVAPGGELYLVSKTLHSHNSKVFHVPKHLWGNSAAEYITSNTHLAFYSSSYGPVAGDISPNGQEVLMKTYGHVYYWSVPDGNYLKALATNPQTLAYHWEKQGEAICWDQNGQGFYTASEGSNSPLYYYRRY